ncbi:hypothetical protein CAC42_1568 [Sphaceloma murrayae]|uniref:FAD-binding FR-type domain-containing protein n=1 Tax=Sphaceloma murrayae TaxID=2082308 RepID=A0A2K1R341_9PEZI|nr:hypothetical protein CAC42_1568 [Sphaceloma murrayae]
MAFFQARDWHQGEVEMHRRLRVPEQDNPAAPMLTPQAAALLPRAPLLAIGTLDDKGRPWTTVWGGDTGLAQSLGNSTIGIRTPVAATLDPVIELLIGNAADGEVVKEEAQARLVSGLTIDLLTRKRVKIAGSMVAGALNRIKTSDEVAQVGTDEGEAVLQLVVRINESLGNCPKYINKKEITSSSPRPRLVSDTIPLPLKALDLLQTSDLFFLSTTHSGYDMDTNHRGGPPGFVRVLENDDKTILVYPEYSGNRLYQSLGNMITNPQVGICFPDFATGNCLFVSGSTEILVGKDAASLITRSNLAVKITVEAARFVEGVLPFRGTSGESSPYNPTVRYLATEKSITTKETASGNQAILLEQTPLTPTISRFRFSLSNTATYTAGQYVTLDVSEHLDIGYSHMRDDDPRSLNDDFVRTFTVSSPPGNPPRPSRKLKDDEFEITIRKVGIVTDLLFKHGLATGRPRPKLEVGVKGFGGSFSVAQDDQRQKIGYVAAGVGITPLLPSLSSIDLGRLRLLWTVRAADVGLVADTISLHPELAKGLIFFVTGDVSTDDVIKTQIETLVGQGVTVEYRRMEEGDVAGLLESTSRWYVCTGLVQRNVVLKWLEGREVVYEDYNF